MFRFILCCVFRVIACVYVGVYLYVYQVCKSAPRRRYHASLKSKETSTAECVR